MAIMRKYRNQPTIVDGIKFDSRAESARYLLLRVLERAGQIRDLELQPEFILQEGFRKNGKAIRAIKYVADFRYYDNAKQKEVIEDVKGKKTSVYQLKKKLFEKRYPELEITEVP